MDYRPGLATLCAENEWPRKAATVAIGLDKNGMQTDRRETITRPEADARIKKWLVNAPYLMRELAEDYAVKPDPELWRLDPTTGNYLRRSRNT